MASLYFPSFPLSSFPACISDCDSTSHFFIMKLLQDCWVSLIAFFDALTLNLHEPTSQHALIVNPDGRYGELANDGPSFRPPSRPQDPDQVLQCNYTLMGKQWQPCSTNDNRGCWLKGPNGQQFNISTDYETLWPTGITRKVDL